MKSKNEIARLVKESREFKRSYNKQQRFIALSCSIFPGILMICFLIFILLVGYDSDQIFWMIIISILFGGAGIVSIIAGIRILKKNPYKRSKKEIRIMLKKLTFIVIVASIIFFAIIAFYKMNSRIDYVTITDSSKYINREYGTKMGVFNYNRYCIYVDDIKKRIRMQKK